MHRGRNKRNPIRSGGIKHDPQDVWAVGRENFTYHYVASPQEAAHYIRLPGPTEGSMAVFFQELEDGVWEDWYHPTESLELEECIEEGVAL